MPSTNERSRKPKRRTRESTLGSLKLPQGVDPTQTFVTSSEAAVALRIAPITLAKWRMNKKGPKWHKFGSAIRYRLSDLLEWADAQGQGVTKQSA